MFRYVHLLFEQSGIFRDAFRHHGFTAFDYDISDQFGKTDFKIDLFVEIENAFDDKPSLFDRFSSEDLLFAFFPCVRFEDQIIMCFRGESYGQRAWSDEAKALYNIDLMFDLSRLYTLFHKFLVVLYRRELRCIIENPYSTSHFLIRYSFLRPSLIDFDRRIRGDKFKKPTQYFFINLDPSFNFIFENSSSVDSSAVVSSHGISRSLISSEYADRFIREQIL